LIEDAAEEEEFLEAAEVDEFLETQSIHGLNFIFY